MQKPTVIHQETEIPASMADDKPHGMKRKSISISVPSHTPLTQTESQKICGKSQEQYVQIVLPPHGYLPTQNRSFISRIRACWISLSRRQCILIIMFLICLLTLITGLSAGLSPRSRTQNLPSPSAHGGPYNGVLTYFDPAVSACGIMNTGADAVAAVSHIVYDAASVGPNPNTNPLCGRKIRARRGDKSIDLTVVDRCTGCQSADIDVTRSVFAELANIGEGRVPVSWNWLSDVPKAAGE